MIPKNINSSHILNAMGEIEKSKVLYHRISRKFLLEYDGRHYPPKYVISLANKYANGRELKPSEFSGGKETNDFLKNLGFNIIEIPFSEKTTRNSSKKKIEKRFSTTRHNERCPKCKETIKKVLEKIYGKVEVNFKFEAGAHPEDLGDTLYYEKLQEIYNALQKHRNFKEFIKAKIIPNCDFFIPEPGFIVEFDESQHFSLPRKTTLKHYPKKLKVGFDKGKWMILCETTNARDNDPPYRDEQRAWYDTLRDFLPAVIDLKPTVRLYSKEVRWCSLSPENPEHIKRFKELVENRQRISESWIATVILKSNGRYSNKERLDTLSKIVECIVNEVAGSGVILFPGGWFSAGQQRAETIYKWVEENVGDILSRKNREIIACVGVDGRETSEWARDQIGAAITKKGIIALGRKFHPAPKEKKYVELAKDHLSQEDNKSRYFELSGRKYFLCACYDSFGIKQKEIPNFGIDIILDLIHGFYSKGEGNSGEANFARHGLAGASNQWRCPVFAATIFFRDNIPQDWPSGVHWDKGKTYHESCTYDSIRIQPSHKISLEVPEGACLIRIYWGISKVNK